MAAVKVVRSMTATLQPRAECLGEDEAHPSNCPESWDFDRDTVARVKAHVKANPTHSVLVVHESRSVYEAGQ